MIRLSLKYIRYFKQQSLYVLFGIIATVAILTAINSAFETNHKMELERAREIAGDYHYFYNRLTKADIEKAMGLKDECGIEKMGYLRSGKVYGAMENSAVIGLKSMYAGYPEIFGMQLLEGRYPEAAGEIALEEWVLPYFTEAGIGASIELKEDGHTDVYTVTGILKDREEDKGFGQKIGYVSQIDTEGGYYQLFIKFDEGRNIKKLFTAFDERFGHQKKVAQNRDVLFKIDYKVFNEPGYDLDLNQTAENGATSGQGENFQEWLAGIGADKALGTTFITVFSMIILYSIFRISVQQRIREYGKMEAFGLEIKDIAVLLGSELFILFLIGFPLGTGLGAALSWGIYQYYSQMGAVHFSVSYLEQLPLHDILRNAGLVLLILLFIVWMVTIQISRMSIIEAIKGKAAKEGTKKHIRFMKMRKKNHTWFWKTETSKRNHIWSKKSETRKRNRIWSKKTNHMMPVVLLKYFQEKKGRVITMILMLALGGTVFLTGSYVEEQTERNHRLTQISKNGTNADIRVSVENQWFSGEISEEQAEKIKALQEVDQAEPVAYYYGALLLKKDQIKKSIQEEDFAYWKTQDKYNSLIASAGGHLVQEGEEQYHLKSNFYGYEEEILKELEDFVVEGTIDSVKEKDTVIWQALLDGVGNRDIVNLHVGDEITIRSPKENPVRITNDNAQILGMLPKGEYKEAYEERTFTIGAIVTGNLAANENFLMGSDNSGIIMPNERFREIFDAGGYNILSVHLKDRRMAKETVREIRSVMEGANGCSVIDYTDDIIRQEEYLEQTMILVRIVVILLLAIGFFNTLSSVNYILVEKQKDFAVMRAMGITDSRLLRTMAVEGLVYGIIMSILMVVFTLLLQMPVKYFMDHGFIFLNAQYTFNWRLAFGITGLNMLLGVAAVILPAKKVLFHEITEELTDQG